MAVMAMAVMGMAAMEMAAMGMAAMVKASLLRVLGPEAGLAAWAKASWPIRHALLIRRRQCWQCRRCRFDQWWRIWFSLQ
jgi:hypothetical protein